MFEMGETATGETNMHDIGRGKIVGQDKFGNGARSIAKRVAERIRVGSEKAKKEHVLLSELLNELLVVGQMIGDRNRSPVRLELERNVVGGQSLAPVRPQKPEGFGVKESSQVERVVFRSHPLAETEAACPPQGT